MERANLLFLPSSTAVPATSEEPLMGWVSLRGSLTFGVRASAWASLLWRVLERRTKKRDRAPGAADEAERKCEQAAEGGQRSRTEAAGSVPQLSGGQAAKSVETTVAGAPRGGRARELGQASAEPAANIRIRCQSLWPQPPLAR